MDFIGLDGSGDARSARLVPLKKPEGNTGERHNEQDNENGEEPFHFAMKLTAWPIAFNAQESAEQES